MSRKPKAKHNPKSRETKISTNPDSFNSQKPVWRFSNIDFCHEWGWDYLGSLVRVVIDNELEDALIEHEDEVLMDKLLDMNQTVYSYDKFIAHINRATKKDASIDIVAKVAKKLDRGYLIDKVLKKLIIFESKTWNEIKGNEHHSQPYSSLNKDAQKRLRELELDDANLFSFRLEGTIRVWGILDRGVFSLLWYDPYHKVYPSPYPDTKSRIIK